ncbi:MAG: pantetheine-phosphate adenylyltransferase [Flavobacteriales bacterium]|nr:pantetheine-phosphate adenylyltransferase [Flavobacteriales bacterium]|tara:strand:+ start:42188 stop:42667 length:480 start_codon:yes stop_codon:yes gene_type:complete
MSQKRIAVFPGSFDPLTKGHEAVVLKALPLFDEIIIAIGTNNSKKNYFSKEERIQHIETVFKKHPKISVKHYTGLTIEFCKKHHAQFIVRGLRDGKDFEYEKSIAIINNQIEASVDTVFFMTDAKYSAINSVIIRDILRNGGDVSQFLPDELNNLLASA